MAENEQEKKLTQEEYLARKYGDYQASGLDRIEAEIEDRHGNKKTIWIREFTEEDLQLREEVMIDQSGVMRNAKQQAKNSRRKARGGAGVPQIKVKPSNRRRFDMIEGVADWNLTRIKFDKDGGIVFETDESGSPKTDEEGYPVPVIEDIPCTPKEKQNVKGYLSEQMIREVRKVNDLPIESEDEDEDGDEDVEPTSDNVYESDFDMSNYEGFGEPADKYEEGEEGSEDEVDPLANRRSSRTESGSSGDTSKNKQGSGSGS